MEEEVRKLDAGDDGFIDMGFWDGRIVRRQRRWLLLLVRCTCCICWTLVGWKNDVISVFNLSASDRLNVSSIKEDIVHGESRRREKDF